LLSSIASILNAVAWPGVAAWFLFTHRDGISRLLKVIGNKLSSAKKVKIPGVLELEEVVDEAISEAGAQVNDADTPKSVPKNQLQAAVNLREKISDAQLPESSVIEIVRRQIFELASEYEAVREQMPSGHMRTRKMNEIAAGMRTLALAGLPLRTQLTRSDSVGKRLAAICFLQVEPRPRYFRWLIEIVRSEKQAFILYQAAVAILELVKKRLYVNVEEIKSEISGAIQLISEFRGGKPDQNTLDVLNEALSLVR
jgi:hypothetical protein